MSEPVATIYFTQGGYIHAISNHTDKVVAFRVCGREPIVLNPGEGWTISEDALCQLMGLRRSSLYGSPDNVPQYQPVGMDPKIVDGKIESVGLMSGKGLLPSGMYFPPGVINDALAEFNLRSAKASGACVTTDDLPESPHYASVGRSPVDGCLHSAQDWYIDKDGSIHCHDCEEKPDNPFYKDA